MTDKQGYRAYDECVESYFTNRHPLFYFIEMSQKRTNNKSRPDGIYNREQRDDPDKN